MMEDRHGYTSDDVREWLRAATKGRGGQAAFAKKHGISPMYVSDCLRDLRGFGPKMLKALGFKRATYYVRSR